MFPRLLPYSVRQFRCCFVAVLIVCAIMAVAVMHFHPKSLVSVSEKIELEGKRKALTINLEKNDSAASDEEKPAQLKQTESVKFLPVTENINSEGDSEPELKAEVSTDLQLQNAQKVVQNPVYYYTNPAVAAANMLGQPPVSNEKIRTQLNRHLPQNTYISQMQYLNEQPVQTLHTQPFVPSRRLIHFDLKGAPPKIDYLKKVMEIVAKLGATGILLEYEDMFPYEGSLKTISASNHYSKEEIKTILAAAKSNHLEVIPLVQTFGHLEYALKLEQFAPLRENPSVPQAICPSRNESLRLVEELIDQVMSLHKGIKYLHVGCDEVFHMGECSLCKTKNRDDLFLNHVRHVAKYVRNKYNIVPIIWDDMMRHITVSSLLEAEMGTLVEPMVWVYAENVYHFASADVYQRYSEVFPSFWVSSAYKGAFGETLVLPDVKRHLENNMNWLRLSETESPKFKEGLRGIAITGWQRYDHFSNLCELLPASIPSMAVNILAVSKGYYNDSLAPALYSALSCTSSPKFSTVPDLQHGSDRFLTDKMSACFFPGAPYFKAAARFIRVEKEIHEFVRMTTRWKGWMTDYSVRHNFSSPARVDELVRDLSYHGGTLHTLAKSIIQALMPIFDSYTISEWMEQKMLPLFESLDTIQTQAQQLKARKYWPQRPLKKYDGWDYYSIKIEDEMPTQPPQMVVQPGPGPSSHVRRIN